MPRASSSPDRCHAIVAAKAEAVASRQIEANTARLGIAGFPLEYTSTTIGCIVAPAGCRNNH